MVDIYAKFHRLRIGGLNLKAFRYLAAYVQPDDYSQNQGNNLKPKIIGY